MTIRIVKPWLATVASLLLCAMIACSVTVVPDDDGVSGTVTIANKTFSFKLGSTGVFEIRADGTSARNAAQVQPLFSEPAETPASGVIAIDLNDIDVVPLDVSKVIVSSQIISGSAQLAVYIGSASSENPCTEGTYVGAFALAITDGVVTVDDAELDLPAAALAEVITGTFSICLEMTGTVDMQITIDGMDIEFGPAAESPDVPGTCTDDSDCASGETCVDGDCVEDTSETCTTDSDCGTDETCEGGQCVEATGPDCDSDGDCDAGYRCTDGVCVPDTTAECTSDGDCAGDETCVEGECVASSTTGCTEDADCQADEVCTDGECVTAEENACDTDADCESGEVCVAGECVTQTIAETAEIEYRQTMTVLVNVDDVDDYLADEPHECGHAVVSADGSTVAFKSWVDGWRVPDATDEVHTYVINADGTGLTDLTGLMPADMRPDTLSELLLNDDGTRLFARYNANIYYINLPSGAWTLAVAEQDSLGSMGGHKPFMINGAGTRTYFLEDEGWNEVTEKYDRGIYYADLGGSPVSLVNLDELPTPTATPMNMIDLKGNAADGTVLFTWNEDYYAGNSIGLWKAGPSGGAERVDATTHNYMYSVQDMPNKIVTADASLALYHWGTADNEFTLDLIDMDTGSTTTLATDSGLNGLSNFALSGDGKYARYSLPGVSCALHDLTTGDRRETISYYTSFTTWPTELSDLTDDGRYQFQTDTDYTKIYKTDFRPGEGPYTAAPSISAIAFSAEDIPNDESTTITIAATVSDPNGLSTITSVKWIPMFEGQEDVAGDAPLIGDTHTMYDDGTHGDAAAGDGTYTQNTIRTRSSSSYFTEVTLPYAFGLRILATDEDGNHTIADTRLTVTE